MEDALRKLMTEFCERFKLNYVLKYSNSLTQREINALNILGSGKLNYLSNRFGDGYAKIDKEVNKSFNGTGGMGNIEMNDLIRLRNKITNADRNNKITNYLKHNEELSILLTNAYNKIVKENIVDTIPIPVSKGFFSFFKRGKLTMMIHESIHYILSKNGIDFGGGIEGLSPLDEGFCVFMHFRFNKHIGFYKSDRGELTIQYRRWAGFFANLLKNVPDSEIISTIRKYSIADLQRMMVKNEHGNLKKIQENFLRDLISLKNKCEMIEHEINETCNIKKHLVLKRNDLSEQNKNIEMGNIADINRQTIDKIRSFTRSYEDLLSAARDPNTLEKIFENLITIEVLKTFLKEMDNLSNFLKDRYFSDISGINELNHYIGMVKEDVHGMILFIKTMEQMHPIEV